MPNHISNHLIPIVNDDDDYDAQEKLIDQIKQLMTRGDHPFDFNVLIPYPEHWEKADKARWEAMKAMEPGMSWKDLPEDGYNHGGYDWCIEHWGTKWNAYEISYDSYDGIYFQTAWSTPFPIFLVLSKHFPDTTFKVEYADEDRGNNCGIFTIRNGEELSHISDKTRPGALLDPDLFARAIIAEQHLGTCHVEKIAYKHQIEAATKLILKYGHVDGDHHKQWLLDQTLRTLLGKDYDGTIKKYNAEGGEWEEGIAP